MMYNILIALRKGLITDIMNSFLNYLIKYIQLIRISEIVDIAVVAVIIYYIIKLIRETRAMQLVKGLAILMIIFFVSRLYKLNALNYILSGAMQIGLFAVIVIFQPELRNLLERMGRFKVGKFMDFAADSGTNDVQLTIAAVVHAAVDMSATKTGALIVMERETRLGDFMTTGIMLEANVSSGLLENIFVPNTPLHDGAVIIRQNRIMAAGCMLPLTTNNNLSHELGTRHRAAIGLSESTDAIVIVVSEETGKISIARNGTLTRNLTGESLTKALRKILVQDIEKADKMDKLKFWRTKSE